MSKIPRTETEKKYLRLESDDIKDIEKKREPRDTREEIIDLIRDHGEEGIRTKNIRDKMKLTDEGVSYHLTPLKMEGKIRYVKKGREHRYFLTDQAIKLPSTQARIIHRLLNKIVNTSLDRKAMYERIAEKGPDRALMDFKDCFISSRVCKIEVGQMRWRWETYEGSKRPKWHSYFNKNYHRFAVVQIACCGFQLPGYEKIIEKYSNLTSKEKERYKMDETKAKELFEDRPKEDLVKTMKILDCMGRYIGMNEHPGLFFGPKVLSARKLVLNEFVERSVISKNLGERELYEQIIKTVLDKGKSPYSPRSSFIVEPLEEHEERAIKEGIVELLDMKPKERYEKYTKTLEFIVLSQGTDDYSLPV